MTLPRISFPFSIGEQVKGRQEDGTSCLLQPATATAAEISLSLTNHMSEKEKEIGCAAGNLLPVEELTSVESGPAQPTGFASPC